MMCSCGNLEMKFAAAACNLFGHPLKIWVKNCLCIDYSPSKPDSLPILAYSQHENMLDKIFLLQSMACEISDLCSL